MSQSSVQHPVLSFLSPVVNVPREFWKHLINIFRGVKDISPQEALIFIEQKKAFILDVRGSNAFFAAWQPYLFAQLGKAGNQGLVQWSFSDDAQRGLINETNNAKYLSYWVEYWLLRKFP